MQLQKLFTLSGLAVLTNIVGGTASGDGGAAVTAPATSSVSPDISSSASPIHSSVTTSPMTLATSARHTSISPTLTTPAASTSRPHTTTPHTTASQSPTTPAAPIFTGGAGVADAGRNALEALGVVVVAAALV
ncbi:hypothetical protein PHISP_00357 [Aspergillus sp. HF37]|nr:hypothetical protein PHISP_00357 [Aspergillus sp. HF37]